MKKSYLSLGLLFSLSTFAVHTPRNLIENNQQLMTDIGSDPTERYTEKTYDLILRDVQIAIFQCRDNSYSTIQIYGATFVFSSENGRFEYGYGSEECLETEKLFETTEQIMRDSGVPRAKLYVKYKAVYNEDLDLYQLILSAIDLSMD